MTYASIHHLIFGSDDYPPYTFGGLESSRIYLSLDITEILEILELIVGDITSEWTSSTE